MIDNILKYVTILPLSRIKQGENPRRYFDQKKHDEMVASLRLRGMLQPILVRPLPDGSDTYVIVAGGRRYKAALEAFGPDADVPVAIRDMTDQEALEAAIDENDIRDDASETEQADAAVRVLAACQGDRAEASRRLGWSLAKLERRLALSNLSDAVKLALDERRIKVGHAELLAVVPGDKQDKALDTILGAGLDVAKTRELLMRVTQSLGTAVFDKTECTTCPFNSASQRALFETHVDDGHCTNPGCYQLKTEAVEKVPASSAPAEKETSKPGPGDSEPISPSAAPPAAAASQSPTKPAATGTAAQKVAVTAASVRSRASDLREAAWRAAVAGALVESATHAGEVIFIAAMSGSLSQIKPKTLSSRAVDLVGASFQDLDFAGQLNVIRGLGDRQGRAIRAEIGAAYAKDVYAFARVAEMAAAFEVDLRNSWRVDKAFLARFGKDELKLIAQECGLVAHMGEKAFAKLLQSKTDKIVDGMLNATGFDWAGRLPGAMTLDGQYGPPPAGGLGCHHTHPEKD